MGRVCLVVTGVEHFGHFAGPRRAQRRMELLMGLPSVELTFDFRDQVLLFLVDFDELGGAEYGGRLMLRVSN